ncbi:uncharacterized protein E0L32_004689 [Thyridium curvatum]|uniref:Uncharacterized protein n=1 Tax=Thyridium curvatum TaxID=1093900 RepID=A0A507BDW4_9PEZI|nr:uncharacterized protein E0L32_004689 [Thyridium curvatum]TPX15131.1 hypothetical protein E0L32_004689 [Thyridium curvatum]
MDFDIEMGDGIGGEAYPIEEQGIQDDILPVDDAQEPGEVEEDVSGAGAQSGDQTLVLNKIHLRGLDAFNPDDLRAYVKEHYSAGTFDRIEWIDDTSANLLFKTEASASEALIALCAVEITEPAHLPPGELLPAKPYASKPDNTLQVRFALASDRKEAGAAARSRFYLLNPEYDPEERRRRGEFDRSRGKYRDRDGDRYRRGGGGGDRRRRNYEDDEPETFDVNLYDDDEAALAKRESRPSGRRRRRYSSRSRSRSSGSDAGRYARQNQSKELFPDRRPRERNGLSSRNRSASPARSAGGGDMDVDSDRRAGSRNRDKARSIKDRLSRDNSTKELFPTKVSAPGSRAQMDRVDPTDSMTTRLSGMSVLSYDGACDTVFSVLLHQHQHQHQHQHHLHPSGKTSSNSMVMCRSVITNNNPTDRITRPSSDSAFNIRGLAAKKGDEQGFAIKGSAKELFPDKLNNAGKELFADKLHGRGRPRQRAEDHFK